MGVWASRPPAVPPVADGWWVTQTGRGIYTRTVALPLWGKVFVQCVILQTFVLIGVNVAIAVLIADCFMILILALASLTTLFMSYFAVDAVRSENVYQLGAYVTTSFVFLTNYIPQFVGSGRDHSGQRSHSVEILQMVAIACTCSMQMAGFCLALLTYCGSHHLPGFGMRTYKKVGSDPVLLECYRRYQQFCTVLKLDLLFQLELCTFCFLGLRELTWQWWLTTVVQLPLAICWLPLGLLAARRESVSLMTALLVLACAQPPLYALQLFSLGTPNATLAVPGWVPLPEALGLGMPPYGTASQPQLDTYCTQQLREQAFPFASTGLNALYLMALVARLLLLSAAILVRVHFGQGLASRVHQRRSHSHQTESMLDEPTPPDDVAPPLCARGSSAECEPAAPPCPAAHSPCAPHGYDSATPGPSHAHRPSSEPLLGASRSTSAGSSGWGRLWWGWGGSVSSGGHERLTLGSTSSGSQSYYSTQRTSAGDPSSFHGAYISSGNLPPEETPQAASSVTRPG